MRILSFAAIALCLVSIADASPKDSLKHVEADSSFIDLSGMPGLAIELRYATKNNFMHEDLYGPFNRPFLHQIAAKKLQAAVSLLRVEHPGWKILIFDALRPRSVQRKLWRMVVGTPQEPYVANPDRGSVHNFGFALDCSLVDEHGHELDMGTPFDTFAVTAEPDHEAELLKSGQLTPSQIAHRHILRQVMEGAGFIQLPLEWWHYDAISADQVRKNYPIVE